ncbi:hypothetical protein [Pseudomonas sp. W2-17]|uniref:hypothetical protein n=1 Tax=Pseudomonas sp. W2-17 TaxID=3058039 RepID=UPI0034E0CD17
MQQDTAAINDGFPEGVGPGAVFRFLLERRHLTILFQGDDDLLLAKVRMRVTRTGVTATRMRYVRYCSAAAEEYERSFSSVSQ